MDRLRDAIVVDAHLGEDGAQEFAHLEIPESFRAPTVHKDEVDMFEGIPSKEKDPRKSLHIEDVALPELGPGEALVAVMASAINYNTVWTSIFEPVSTFGFLERYGRLSPLTKGHDLPYHVVGSDLSGVVLRVGPGVTAASPRGALRGRPSGAALGFDASGRRLTHAMPPSGSLTCPSCMRPQGL